MANEEKKYTSEFKTKVAQEALSQEKQNLDSLSDKYDVPVSAILTWTLKLERSGADAFDASEISEDTKARIEDREAVDVNVDDPEVAESISHGVMHDDLNYKRLTFWSILGMILVAVFVKGLVEMFQYNSQVTRDMVSEGSEYYQVNEMKREAEETLTSFGVVDLDEGIYRIPIDSAMNDIANGSNNN